VNIEPAWSGAFDRGAIQEVAALPFAQVREWAFGGSTGAGSAAGRVLLNARMTRGSETTRKALRYRRPSTGRSSEPRRGRRRVARAGMAVMQGYSKPAPRS